MNIRTRDYENLTLHEELKDIISNCNNLFFNVILIYQYYIVHVEAKIKWMNKTALRSMILTHRKYF